MTSVTGPAVALVVAAGSGVRLGAPVPKALVEIEGESMISRSVTALAAGGVAEAIVVVPTGHEPQFSEVLRRAPIPVRLVTGGAERQDSVWQGLLALTPSSPPAAEAASGIGPVLIHDAARPLVPASVVRTVIEQVRQGAVAVVPVVPVTDSIRQLADGRSEVIDRSHLRAVQTPQGFGFSTLFAAHRLIRARGLVVTDDAAACEAAGHPVTLVDGAPESIKITTPTDLAFAAALVRADD